MAPDHFGFVCWPLFLVPGDRPADVNRFIDSGAFCVSVDEDQWAKSWVVRAFDISIQTFWYFRTIEGCRADEKSAAATTKACFTCIRGAPVSPDCPQCVNLTPDLCCGLHEWLVFLLRGGTVPLAHAACFLLRALAAKNRNDWVGLTSGIRRAMRERPLLHPAQLMARRPKLSAVQHL